MKKENVVSCLHLPASANVEKIISCPQYGEVAAVLDWNGMKLTFFRVDFLDFERVAWYFAEQFCDTWYHEDVPESVKKSVAENGGFFVSSHFVTPAEVEYEEAMRLTSGLELPELKSALMYGVIYDVLGKWLLATGTLTEAEWLNSPTDKISQKQILTRDCGGWSVQELLGDIFQKEWTQEQFNGHYVVARAGQPDTDGEGQYPSRMRYAYARLSARAHARAFLYF